MLKKQENIYVNNIGPRKFTTSNVESKEILVNLIFDSEKQEQDSRQFMTWSVKNKLIYVNPVHGKKTQ